jgi:alanyl-tRNA synthetase
MINLEVKMSEQKSYFNDSYITEFYANIIEVVPYDGKYAIILDKSYFYPESGGQPSDLGTINGIEIVFVTEENGNVLHIMQNQLSTGPANCQINWGHRFDNMQQHTGQHILSACFYKLYSGETSSFHIGKDSSTIEISVDSFDNEMIEKIELLANHIVFNNTAITANIVDKQELASFPLRKQPQVESNIRIITIEGCDCSPCGGTHVSRTGEVGLIKIKRQEKLKNSYKFEFVCGNRALNDYTNKNYIINRLSSYLSTPEQAIESAYLKFTEDYKSLQKQLSQLRSEIVNYDVQQLQQSVLHIKDLKVIVKVFENRDFNDIKLISQALILSPSTIALLATKAQSSQLIFARSENIETNMNNLLKVVLPLINGKGGGSPKAAQGGGIGDVDAALMAALDVLKA